VSTWEASITDLPLTGTKREMNNITLKWRRGTTDALAYAVDVPWFLVRASHMIGSSALHHSWIPD
jgi:hypothetical protein